MAGMITWNRLRELAAFRAQNGLAISLYLGLDPSTAGTMPAAATKINSLLDEAQKSTFANRNELTHDQKRGLQSDFERVRSYLENDFDRAGTQGLAIFAAGLDTFWSANALSENVPDRVCVGPDFHLKPLVPLVGRGEGAIVAVIDRERGLLFRLTSGRLETLADLSEEQPGRHDQGGWSQARYQRHIEKLVEDHLRGVAEELERQIRRRRGTGVVIVSSEETRSTFEDALSHDVSGAVIGWTSAEAHAGASELLEAVKPLVDEWHAREEGVAAERWQEEAGRDGRAASGWEKTLESASDGRVELLLVQEGADRPAWECPSCGRASAEGGSCPLDGTQLEERQNGLDLAVHQTLAHGGTVCTLSARHDLEPVEGIGALLRY